MTSQQDKAELLLKLHEKGSKLLVPNAWDAASACVFEAAGFPAIATTSAGVAFSLGYQDGEQITRDDMLGVIARIASAVKIPVSADVEAGYGASANDVVKTVHGVIDAGAVGINLEDGTGEGNILFSQEKHAERVAAARQAASDAGVAIVINARTDTYLLEAGEAATRLEDTIGRARAYLQAGADSIFIPGVVDPAIIRVLVREIPGPLNIMAGPGAPTAPELFALGVTRISVGTSIMLATMGLVRDIASELHDKGTWDTIGAHGYGWGSAVKLFRKRGE